ncbi:MAG: DUF2167 domain-containing protein [bacterium]|nr:DUF2167 domain-containing protein [bacterium]
MTSAQRQLVIASMVLCLLSFSPLAVQAQEPAEPTIEWQAGPGTAPIGDFAELDLPDDFVYLDAADTKELMLLFENPVSDTELATVAPASDDEQWFLVFEWDDMGYVKDDEEDLDPDAILSSIRQGTEAANEERRQRGWATMDIVGWQEEPNYDPQTHNLTWAIIGASDGHQNINRIVKLLGRRGVMTATLVSSPEELAAASLATDRLLAGYSFNSGSTYAEFLPGKDRVAEVGLAALVVGGAGAALVKSGLLARLWKLIVVGVLALVAFVRKLFGGGQSEQEQQA